ncbi:hypothetical protein ACHHYP_07773 [Achlya hypogyna]|uniref:Uncharacterized protein n=1 Tax=Achlya hypogyna TaxID=1202772 RepID=A0A1V9YQC9_ACHHY|nr:hypothetical protein ACHHYP_07773 [Achlya hypogyna]
MKVLNSVVAGILAVPTVYFATVLGHAIVTVSLAEGFAHICENVWATSGLLDYCIGLLFTVPYLWLRTNALPAKLVLATGAIFLGNVFSVTVFIYYILRSGGTLREALLPVRKATPPVSGPSPMHRVFVGLTLVSMLVFAFYCCYCLAVQPISEGWQYIKGDTWSYVTVIDVWTGIAMVITYVIVREFRDAKLFALGMVIALVLLGNGATCFYLLHLTIVRFPRWSLRDVFLWNDNDANVGEEAPLSADKAGVPL